MGLSTPYYDVILAALAAASRAQVVVELGTYQGQTTARLASAVLPHGGHVWTVDDDRDGGVSLARQRITDLGLTEHVTFVHAQSDAVVEAMPVPIDLLFCDADHTRAGLAAEWCTWAPLVAPGGVAAVHDTAGGDPADWARETFPCRGWDALMFPWEAGLLVARKWEARCR